MDVGGAEDPYAVLGVAAGASEREVRRAYRHMALRWHPDKNPDRPEEIQASRQFRRCARCVRAPPPRPGRGPARLLATSSRATAPCAARAVVTF